MGAVEKHNLTASHGNGLPRLSGTKILDVVFMNHDETRFQSDFWPSSYSSELLKQRIALIHGSGAI